MKKKSASVVLSPKSASLTANPKQGSDSSKGWTAPGGRFPIVGIGASAGGLEVIEQFLHHVPEGSGMAFVIVQHLDPTHQGILPELLQRATAMTVSQVKDRTTVEPNCVYVIPPNKDLTILHGVLYLLQPTPTSGLRLPIDSFFRSLAQDQQERGIGVILSGMGADGTLGLRAIKAQAGLVLVQDPTTAKFDSMPRSAVDSGLADVVAPADELPEKMIACLQQRPNLTVKRASPGNEDDNALEKIVILLRSHAGNDFSCYKRNTLARRVERRMEMHQIDTIEAYVRYMQENSQEIDLLFKELLIGVTSFFRDAESWEALRTQVIPTLLSARTPGQTLRAWVPGCSTGEEAYSLAMVIKEAIDELYPEADFTLQIFATDLNVDAIDQARRGIYTPKQIMDISALRLKRFFLKEEGGYRVRKEIRQMVVFAPQNLIMDPPFTKLDFLCCRNLLIYLTAEVQKKLIPLFHYSLSPGGILFLGSAEALGEFAPLFTPLVGNTRLFRRTESLLPSSPIEFPSSFTPAAKGAKEQAKPSPTTSLQTLADQLILQRYAPPAVITNEVGDIFYVSGRTGKYLEPAAGKANWNLFAMAREGLHYELTGAFQEALRGKAQVELRGLKIGTNGGTQLLDVSVRKLEDPAPLHGLVIVTFTDLPAPSGGLEAAGKVGLGPPQPVLAALEQELFRVREEARATYEEMQTAQEELRSANEEMQSTNEELQSSNEELTTSKEEMQSMNEELQTVNAEMQIKMDEFSRTSNDMKNLLDSTDIATLFLDKQLHVRRFTPQTTKIIKLLASDAGRPITDLATDLNYPELVKDAHEVLRKLVSVEKAISASEDRWFTVRIMPYRTVDDRIDGVVITFSDITVAKTLEAKLRSQQLALERQVAQQTGKEIP